MSAFLREREGILAFVFFLGGFAFLYPELVLMQATPMGGDPWTIQDPAVSWAAFMPGWREFRFELLSQGNFLWSDLRAMGQPMLGNGVQAAPMFPLNLAMIALPDNWYWSAMPILRVVLIALALFLTARKVFRLSILASLVFALLCGFNLNIMRWINHTWVNGILAGVWYFYFLCCVLLPPNSGFSPKKGHIIGLIVAVYGMVTAGFPEASAVSAILVMFLFIGVVFAYWANLKLHFANAIQTIVFCHIAGFSLSAPQIFALLEYIEFTLAMDLREGYIGGGYTSTDAVSFVLAQFSIFWKTSAQKDYLNFYIGFIGAFLVFRGLTGNWIFKSLKTQRSLNKQKIQTRIAVAFIGLIVLYVVKSFNLSETLEWVFSVTPVLAQSHFPFYFSPLLYFGLAYFAALGIERIMESFSLDKNRRVAEIGIAMAGMAVAIYLSYRTVALYSDVPSEQFWELFFTSQAFTHGRYFVLVVIAILLLLGISLNSSIDTMLKQRSSGIKSVLAVIILAVMLMEFSHSYPKNFTDRGHIYLEVSQDIKSTIKRALDTAPLPRHELRGYNKFGTFVGEGLATIDNGVSAMLGPDLRGMRLGLFNVEYGGYVSLDSAKTDWSYEAMSNNIQAIHMTPKMENDWSAYTVDPSFNNSIEGPKERVVKMGNPFYLQGIATSYHDNPSQPRFWYKFEGERESFWVEGNLSGFNSTRAAQGGFKSVSNWRLRIPVEWLPEARYKFSLRHFNPNKNSYFDTEPIILNLDKSKTATQAEQELKRLSFSKDNTRHIYFNPKALPRAFVASSCQLKETKKQIQKFLYDSPSVIRGVVGLHAQDDWPSEFCDSYENKFRRIAITQEGSSNLDLGEITGPAVLVVNDSFYPGWSARDRLSGEPLEIKPANLAVRAVYLPESRDYHVQLNYRPWWLTLVYLLLVLGIVITGYLLLVTASSRGVMPIKHKAH